MLFMPLRVNREPLAFTVDRVSRLTESGSAYLAELSADGRYLVHGKRGNAGVGESLWVRQTATTSDVQIVPPSDDFLGGATFSPDGNYVYYVKFPRRGGIRDLYRVPTLGGAPVRVLEHVDAAPAFSRDGRRMAFVRFDVARKVANLMVASLDGSEVRSVAASEGTRQFHPQAPAWSPDGRTILVPTDAGDVMSTVVSAVDTTTGAVTVIGKPWVGASVRWMPDGRSFVLNGAESDAGKQQLWQVAYPSGESRHITNDLNGYVGVSLSADGKVLATVQFTNRSRLWMVAGPTVEPKMILADSTRNDEIRGTAWTPAGGWSLRRPPEGSGSAIPTVPTPIRSPQPRGRTTTLPSPPTVGGSTTRAPRRLPRCLFAEWHSTGRSRSGW